MFRIVFLGQFRGDTKHFHGDDIQTFAFKAMDDFADETTLDAIGFQKNEGGFHGLHRFGLERRMFHGAPESKLGALLMGQHRNRGLAPSGRLGVRSEELRHSLSLN